MSRVNNNLSPGDDFKLLVARSSAQANKLVLNDSFAIVTIAYLDYGNVEGMPNKLWRRKTSAFFVGRFSATMSCKSA